MRARSLRPYRETEWHFKRQLVLHHLSNETPYVGSRSPRPWSVSVEAIDWDLEVFKLLGEKSDSRLTMEHAAYVVIGLLAAGLRFFQLGLRPLSEAEAGQALAAFRFTEGAVQSAPAGTIPALFTGNVAGFALLEAGDATARWLPALVGLILVLLPYGLRHRLGRGGALMASLLLTISPSMVYCSRNLDGAILVAACGLALAVGLISYVDTRQSGYLYLAVASLGLGLTAGPGTLTLLLIFLAFALLLYLGEQLSGGETGWSALQVAWGAVRGEEGLLAKMGAVLAVAFGLVATTFVLHPAGVGHAADLIGAWAWGFLPEQGGQPFIYPLLLLLRYESLILISSVVEIGCWIVKRRTAQQRELQFGSALSHTALLIFWAVVGLAIVLVAGHRPAGNVLMVIVPLALLAGQGVERAWHWIGRRVAWGEVGIVVALGLGIGVFFYLWIVTYSQTSQGATVGAAGITLYASQAYLILASVAIALWIGLGVVAWLLRGPGLALGGGWLALLIALGLLGFKAMWGVNLVHASDPHELMIMQTTAPDVRLLVERLESLSLDKAGDAHSLSFTVDAATGPVVAWYLREFKGQMVVDGFLTSPQTAAAVTLAAPDLPIGETYRGQGFPLRAHWMPWGVWRQKLVRWLLFTDGALPVVDQEVVLWIESES
jgi:uncharacterized protein (TIGR03663 family)